MGSLTRTEFRIFEIVVQLACWLGALAANWDKGLKILVPHRSPSWEKIYKAGIYWLLLAGSVVYAISSSADIIGKQYSGRLCN